MTDRYEIRRNKDTYLYDIWDLVKGTQLFCSFTTESRADEVCKQKNSQFDTANLHKFRTTTYVGDVRVVSTEPYRFPTMDLEVKSGMVVLSYR